MFGRLLRPRRIGDAHGRADEGYISEERVVGGGRHARSMSR